MRIFPLLLFIFCQQTIIGQPTIGTLALESHATEGYSLISPTASNRSYLIDNCGHVINQWESNFNVGVSAYLSPDGTLTRTGRANGVVLGIGGAGGLIEQYNWEGELIWSYIQNDQNVLQHHDLHILDNGNILFLSLESKTEAEAIQAGRDPTALDNRGLYSDAVYEINPNTNEIVWKWSIWDHLIQDYDPSKDNYGVIAEHPERLDINYSSIRNPDFIHFNSVDYDPVLDQVLVSSNNVGELFIIDHSTTTAEAASTQGGNGVRGGDFLWRWGDRSNYDQGTAIDDFFYSQHSARFIHQGKDQGKIIVFNNGSGRPGQDRYSSVEIIAPLRIGYQYETDSNGSFLPDVQDWVYEGDKNYYSARMSSCVRLENDHTLIAYANIGQIIEIDADDQIVWSYIVPTRNGQAQDQGTNPAVNDIFHTIKYSEDYFIDDLIFTVGATIEISENNSFCSLLSTTDEQILLQKGNIFYPNPATDKIAFAFPTKKVWVYTLTGKLISYHEYDHLTAIDLDLASGLYIIKVEGIDGQLYSDKLIKL